jgi:hypothetical protein
LTLSPSTHHYTDSTHTTPGVVTAGIERSGVTLEASRFRGEEPDEHRLGLGGPKLDSWSARATWRHGPWLAQFSGGHLHRPEPFELANMQRLTASIEFNGTLGSRPFAASLVWGENREVHGVLDGAHARLCVRSLAGALRTRRHRRRRDHLSRRREHAGLVWIAALGSCLPAVPARRLIASGSCTRA